MHRLSAVIATAVPPFAIALLLGPARKAEPPGPCPETPLRAPKGPTYAFTIDRRIVLVRNDTTYLRHEMLHHVLEVAGWHPRQLRPGKQYSIADLHPMPLFGLCTGGH
jgi:hypothetical protein